MRVLPAPGAYPRRVRIRRRVGGREVVVAPRVGPRVRRLDAAAAAGGGAAVSAHALERRHARTVVPAESQIKNENFGWDPFDPYKLLILGSVHAPGLTVLALNSTWL